VGDQHPDDKADEGSHSEDRPCGGYVGLKFTLEFEQLRLGQNGNSLRYGCGYSLLHGHQVASWIRLDDSELDIRSTAERIGQQLPKGTISAHHGAFFLEVRTK